MVFILRRGPASDIMISKTYHPNKRKVGSLCVDKANGLNGRIKAFFTTFHNYPVKIKRSATRIIKPLYCVVNKPHAPETVEKGIGKQVLVVAVNISYISRTCVLNRYMNMEHTVGKVTVRWIRMGCTWAYDYVWDENAHVLYLWWRQWAIQLLFVCGHFVALSFNEVLHFTTGHWASTIPWSALR